MPDLIVWTLLIGLTLICLSLCWGLVRATSRREDLSGTTCRRLAAYEEEQFVTSDEVPPIPSGCDIRTACMIHAGWQATLRGEEPSLPELRERSFYGDAAFPESDVQAEAQIRTN